MSEAQRPNVFEVELDQSITKEEFYKQQLQGITPEAFFVLGGGNRKTEGDEKKGRHKDRYSTSPYTGKFYPQKTGGAKARPIAAAELSKFYPKAKIVTLSHRPNKLFQLAEETSQPVDSPAYSTVLAEDLKRMGVRNEIIEKPHTVSSLTEIMEAITVSAQNNWQDTAVVTNDYHIERCQKVLDILKDDEKRKLLKNQLSFLFSVGEETEVFDKKWGEFEHALDKFKNNDSSIVFVSSENILLRRSSHHAALVRNLREQDGYRNVVEQERIGNHAVDEGRYNFAQDSFKEFILAKKAA